MGASAKVAGVCLELCLSPLYLGLDFDLIEVYIYIHIYEFLATCFNIQLVTSNCLLNEPLPQYISNLMSGIIL